MLYSPARLLGTVLLMVNGTLVLIEMLVMHLVVMMDVMCRKKPLKLILTSATLDAEKFSAYFFGCPVLHIPGRQYEVQIVFSEENYEKNYAAAAVDAALDMHLHQPPGDILVFLTGQAEIDRVCIPSCASVNNFPLSPWQCTASMNSRCPCHCCSPRSAFTSAT